MFNRIRDTWRRLSEGLTVQELWTQFRKETTASYRLYTKEIDAREQGERKGRTWWRNVKAITWSILDKLSPTRRIILVLALVLTALGRVEFAWGSATFSFSFRGWGFLLILLLLVLELADRVT